MKNKLHIKRGDWVRVIAGDEKGNQGEVLKVFPEKNRAIVKGLNKVTCHIKPTQEKPKGSREEKEASIHLSNLIFLLKEENQTTRIGRRKNEAGKLARYAKKTKKFV